MRTKSYATDLAAEQAKEIYRQTVLILAESIMKTTKSTQDLIK